MYGTQLSLVLGNTEKHQTAVREYPEASGENRPPMHGTKRVRKLSSKAAAVVVNRLFSILKPNLLEGNFSALRGHREGNLSSP